MVKSTRFLQPFIPAIALLLALCLSASVLLADGSLDDSRQKLEEIQRRIRQTSKNLKEKAVSERNLSSDLKTVERELARIKARIRSLSSKIDGLEGEIADKKKAIDQLEASMAALEIKVRQRLVALYKGGETSLLKVLFSSSSPARLAENYDFLSRIVRRDRELLAEYRGQMEELRISKEQLDELKQRQLSALGNLKEDRKTLDQAAKLKEELLAAVRRDRRELSAQLEELKEKAGRLASLVKKLESEKYREYTPGTGIFSSQKGHLPWPVTGDVKVGFGTWRHPELGTLYESQGIEIAVAPDRPIDSVWDGEVIFADRFKGYGNLIIVDHGENYYSLYAQASRLVRKVGDKVKKGDTLAFSGYEGADGVYFEIRHRGDPLDPTAWLSPH
jgi:septal ring factor EnvC (AmiA/AmiB activator)